MSQLKATSTDDIVSKADQAAEAEGISRAELIRRAVEEYADDILDESTEAINDTTGIPDDFDYLSTLAEDVESLEDLGEVAEESNEPYPVSHDIDVDWANKVKTWRRHRFPVLRAWLDASGSPAVPHERLRSYLLNDFDISEASLFRDLKELPEQGCAHPMPEVDPRWDSEGVRADILDIIYAGTAAGRDNHAKRNPALPDLLDEEMDDFNQPIYNNGTSWWLYEERWVSTMEAQLERFEQVAFEGKKGNRQKYEIVLRHFVEYLRDCGVDVSGVDRVAERLESDGDTLVAAKVDA